MKCLRFLCLAAVFACGLSANVSSCANRSTSPVTGSDGILYTQFVCSLYYDASSNTIDLTSVMTQGGANLLDNTVGAGYLVVINGDPTTLADNSTGLLNQNLWAAVLFWPGDQWAGSASDSLTMYWPGTFPTTTDVLNLDDSLYPGNPDSAFFVQSTPPETVYAPDGVGGDHEYHVFTPEPRHTGTP